ncbi:MAG: DUF2157 domain-containing protein [Leptospira sp.]|nr:DUF2157 domain-containing protein [Leptospira sp.]
MNQDKEEINLLTNSRAWKHFFTTYFLGYSAIYFISGVTFFFAYNWDDIDRFTKVVLLISLLVILHLIRFFVSKDYLKRSVLDFLVFISYGLNLLNFGQIYQTGADAFDLFLIWSIATVLVTTVSRNFYLFLLWISLVCLTVHLYIEQVHFGKGSYLFYCMLTLALGSIVIILSKNYEIFFPNSQESWAKIYLFFLTMLHLNFSFSVGNYGLYSENNLSFNFESLAVKWILPILTFTGFYFYYRFRFFSISHLSLVLFFLLFFIQGRLMSVFNSNEGFYYLLNFIVILSYTVFAMKHLIYLTKEKKI